MNKIALFGFMAALMLSTQFFSVQSAEARGWQQGFRGQYARRAPFNQNWGGNGYGARRPSYSYRGVPRRFARQFFRNSGYGGYGYGQHSRYNQFGYGQGGWRR